LRPAQCELERYNEHLTDWNAECPPISIEMPFEMEKGVTIQLSDHVKNVRKNAKNKLANIVLIAQTLKSKQHIKYHNLCQYWIQHLVLCIKENNFEESLICGSDTEIIFKRIDKHEAKKHLQEIVSAWYRNRKDVLPVAIGTAFEYLSKGSTQKKYEGDSHNDGEVDRDVYLKRLFPTFEELNSNDEFEKWANELYSPIKEYANEV
jgi:exodeoxyribonuclease V gamma subunit